MEEDGFQLVSRKKAARASIRSSRSEQHSDYEGANTAEIVTGINSLKKKLRNDQFFKDTIATIEAALDTRPVHLLCYGIGRLGSCKIASTQFALLLLLKEHFKVSWYHQYYHHHGNRLVMDYCMILYYMRRR